MPQPLARAESHPEPAVAPAAPLPLVDARVFSGTGNSLAAARWFAGAGGDVRMLEAPAATTLRDGALLLLACPTHGFTAPIEMLRFVRHLPAGAGRQAAVLVTRAGIPVGPWQPPGLAGTAPFALAALLRGRGYAVRGALAVNMPSNWQALHTGLTAPAVARVAAKSRAEVEQFAHRLRNGGRQWLTLNLLYELVFGLALAPISLLYLLAGGRLLGQWFWATGSCTSCGQCGLACPVGAIAMRGQPARPTWSLDCTSCMRCMAYCPKRAIEGNWAWALLSTALSVVPLVWAWPYLGAGSLTLLALATTALSVVVMPPMTRVLLGWARHPALGRLLLALTPTRTWRRYRYPDARLRDLAPHMKKAK
ncbi:MAG: 4Fe-4S binding protein [Deltaproteobacteria bacterium]|nr:4Fe-4S binding protein [Deltaproteobacteria bacterium]